ncbi:MAG: tRNA (N6-threonylcarbamoyladenosine(37)-N6)-methyltransferase TrmO [Micromonosporaceae bacterium]|nr:tRNA (N6-threonylcarbamoyladenosine(37)-N6)-methyltransferase TrmO [Micromonosporaceae bacterium]
MTAVGMELRVIGLIRTPYPGIADCPGQPWTRLAESTIEIVPEYLEAVDGLTAPMRLYVLWWAHLANRDLRRRRPTADASPLGVLASRGMHRPNPIGLTLTDLIAVEPGRITVRGLDCVDRTPLLDLKPAVAIPAQYAL